MDWIIGIHHLQLLQLHDVNIFQDYNMSNLNLFDIIKLRP